MLSVVIFLNIQKLEGFKRIYQAECFPEEVDKMFGKSKGEKNAGDYQSAIIRAENIYKELEK